MWFAVFYISVTENDVITFNNPCIRYNLHMIVQKRFLNLLIFTLVLILSGGIYYLSQKNSEQISNQENQKKNTPLSKDANSTAPGESHVEKPAKVSFSLSGNDVLVMDGDDVIQTLSLNEDAVAALTLEGSYINEQKILTNQDVNFDGNNDVALMTGVGYGGVNIFYDYYIFNPATNRLEKSDILLQISNPEITISAKTITSSFRSGPQWYSQSFTWNGSTYLKSEEILEEI